MDYWIVIQCKNCFSMNDNIHVLHAGEGNMKMYSPGEYILIFPEPACYKCFIIPNETKKTHIVSWHLLGHTIKSVTWFDLQFWRSTHETNDVILYIHSVHKHRGNSFQRQNYKMRLKQRSLNWINSMQVKRILFTNVFFSWSY
jgi:hypothetical protein